MGYQGVLTDEMKETIEKRYAEGEGYPSKISKELGVTYDTVAYYASSIGITKRKKEWTGKERKKLKDLYMSGASYKEICVVLDRGYVATSHQIGVMLKSGELQGRYNKKRKEKRL